MPENNRIPYHKYEEMVLDHVRPLRTGRQVTCYIHRTPAMTPDNNLDGWERKHLRRFYACCVIPAALSLLLFLSASIYFAYRLLNL